MTVEYIIWAVIISIVVAIVWLRSLGGRDGWTWNCQERNLGEGLIHLPIGQTVMYVCWFQRELIHNHVYHVYMHKYYYNTFEDVLKFFFVWNFQLGPNNMENFGVVNSLQQRNKDSSFEWTTSMFHEFERLETRYSTKVGPVGQVTNPPDWLGCKVNAHITFCACHLATSNGFKSNGTTKPVWALPRVSNSKVGLHQASALTPSPPKHTRRRIRSSMAKLGGGDGRFWHCCQLDNLHRTGIGWDGCAKVRAGEESNSSQGSKAERNDKSASPLSFHNWAHLNSLYLSQSRTNKRWRVECDQEECSGAREATERGKASHN